MVIRNRKRPFASLREWRDELGLDQDDAALILGLSQSYYSRVERQLMAPKPKLAKRIADKTGVPLEEVLGVA